LEKIEKIAEEYKYTFPLVISTTESILFKLNLVAKIFPATDCEVAKRNTFLLSIFNKKLIDELQKLQYPSKRMIALFPTKASSNNLSGSNCNAVWIN